MLKTLLKYASFAFICLAFDWLFNLVKQANQIQKWFPGSLLLPAIVDNAAHGVIAALAWILTCDWEHSRHWLFWTVGCGACACFIDVDHFLAARSFDLKHALKLESRPPFHCSSILLLHILMLAISLSSSTSDVIAPKVVLCTFIAIATHHLRDAQRRGVWLWPLGNTPSINSKIVYIASMLSIVLVAKWIRNKLDIIVEDMELAQIEVTDVI